MVNLENM